LFLTSCSSLLDRLDLPDSPVPEASQTLNPTRTPLPVTTPSPTPESPSPEPSPGPTTFTLLAAGDIMAHADNLRAALDVSSGEYDFSENYIYVSDIINEADFSIANLETVTAGSASGYTSYPLFNTPVEILDAIKGAGFDALVTANNHSLDRGIEGVLLTLDEIEARSLLHTGTYSEPETNYLTYDYFGHGISILAYTQHLNGNEPLLEDSKKYMINVMNLESIISDIEKARTHSSLIIVYLHWGNEYTRDTETWQPSYAKTLFEAGADVILGTHPHVVRPAETMVIEDKNKYVIYSMGNYISNFIRTDHRDNAIYTEDGVMVKLTFEIDSSGSFDLSLAEHIPTWPYKYEDEDGLHYEIIPIPDPDVRLHENDYADDQARKSYNRTMETLRTFKFE
ncbi:MAG: CapA family protein, partial [Clostridia bacterium]|nr:CapA family protein [Clostridia bacterium]